MIITDARVDVHAEPEELLTLEEVRALVEAANTQGRLQLVGCDGVVDLPESLYRVLRQVVPLLLQHDSVSIIVADEEVTTQQAADILNVSRQYIVNLVDAGDIPAHLVGTHRRIVLRDLLEYRERRRAKQDAALDELARLSFDEGMYDKRPKRT